MPSYGDGYPRAQIAIAALRGGRGWIYRAGYSTNGMGHHEGLDWVAPSMEAFPDRATAIAAGVDLILASLGRNIKWKIPADILAWLLNPTQPGPHVVNGVDYLNAARAGEARRSAGLEKRHANYSTGPRTPEEETTPLARSVAEHLQDLAAKSKATEAPRPEPSPIQAALEEVIEAVEDHLTHIRRELDQQGLPVAPFEEDTAYLREILARAEAVMAAEGDTDEGDGDPIQPADGAPAVLVRKSITPHHITCLECGVRFSGGLKRHLMTRHVLDPAGYRAKWALPADYPMVAPMFAKERDDLVREAALRAEGAR